MRPFAAVLMASAFGFGLVADVSADVYPDPTATGTTTGLKEAVYGVIRDVDDPWLSFEEIETARAEQREMGRYLAASSGGTFNVYYDRVYDVPIELNPDRTRPGDWPETAEQYLRDHWGLEPDDYYVQIYNLHKTEPYAGQTWAGSYTPATNRISLQSLNATGGLVTHEMGHRIEAVHARAYRRTRGEHYHLYRWDEPTGTYMAYGEDDVEAAAGNFTPVPYGAYDEVQGNYFDVMGNANSMGQFRAHQKRDLGWLDAETHFADLDETGPGTYRVYAHDQLQVVSFYDHQQVEQFGVEEGYADVLYGLTFGRTGEVFNKDLGVFEPELQTINIEYRAESTDLGTIGVLLHVNDRLVDVDPERLSNNVGLGLGQSIEDIDVGLSIFSVTGRDDDFLSYSPPPPGDPSAMRETWYRLTVLEFGTDAVGEYVDLQVTTVPEPGTALMLFSGLAFLLLRRGRLQFELFGRTDSNRRGRGVSVPTDRHPEGCPP